MTRRRVLGLAAIGAVLLVSIPSVWAAVTSSTVSGRAITSVKLLREASPGELASTSATTWADVPGATTTIRIPNGQEGIILARFTSESSCTRLPGSPGPGYCKIRVVVNGIEAFPADGETFAFDSALEDVADWESLSVDRSSNVLGQGLHTIALQWAVSRSDIAFTLDDWHLTIERIKV